MNVLVILFMDVYNFTAVNIVREMLNRNYQIDVYSLRMEHMHIRMFDSLDVEVKDFTDLSIAQADQYDFIYSAISIQALPREWWSVDKYIFHFTTTPYDEPGGYGDYTFTQRDMNHILIPSDPTIEQVKRLQASPGMVSGNPKYDHDESDLKDERQILFVDASHTPDSKAGKMEEAQMLLDIAYKMPDYKLIIKPRYFKEDHIVTHTNRVFLDDCIRKLSNGDLPKNMVMLQEHVDLEEIAKKSELIITPNMTSSYCSIGAYGKRGLIAGNFTVKYPRWEYHTELFQNVTYRSGLVVPFDKICEYLPRCKSFDPSNLKEMGLDIHDASKRIVDKMENIYEKFIIHGRYPGFQSKENGDISISMEEVISIRYTKSLFEITNQYKLNIRNCDFSEVDSYVEKLLNNKEVVNAENYHEYLEKKTNLLYEAVISQYKGNDASYLEQEHYICIMNDLGRFDEILDKKFKAVEMHLFHKARFLINKFKDYKSAIPCLSEYIARVKDSTFEKAYAYQPSYLQSASYWLAVCYFEQKDFIHAKIYFLYCEELTNNGHAMAKKYLEEIERIESNESCSNNANKNG